jgi:hypothetical protein
VIEGPPPVSATQRYPPDYTYPTVHRWHLVRTLGVRKVQETAIMANQRLDAA